MIVPVFIINILQRGLLPTAMDEIVSGLSDFLVPIGFEVYPLKVLHCDTLCFRAGVPNTSIGKIGWYNAVLSPPFLLPYPDDTLAVLVLSTPAMFELAFIPFLHTHGHEGLKDPIDRCVAHYISHCVSQRFAGQHVDVSYDYDMLPSRKPKFLAQTAAHVAGAAYYYQKKDIPDDPWGDRKMFGVCIHPRLGGWFAIRALLVFPDVLAAEDLQQHLPLDCVPSRESRVELLEMFNFRWKDWSYRDIIVSDQCYSQRQQLYFSTPPGQRVALLRQWGLLASEDSEPQPQDESTHGQSTNTSKQGPAGVSG